MPSSLAFSANKKTGFTLIELLVVISILAILSAVGLVSFQGIRARVLDAKYKADIDSIKKAYEKNYDPSLNNGNGGYKQVSGSDFASGATPKDINGNDYIVLPPANTDSSYPSYLACLDTTTGLSCVASPSNTNCKCAVSTQGGGAQVSSLTNPTCDPYGILGNGLKGYWKMDEGVGVATATDTSGNGNNGTPACSGTGCTNYPTFGSAGKLGSAATFNGRIDPNPVLSSYINVPYSATFGMTDKLTVAAWVYFPANGFNNPQKNNSNGSSPNGYVIVARTIGRNPWNIGQFKSVGFNGSNGRDLINGPGEIWVSLTLNGGTYHDYHTGSLTAGQWNHIAFTFNYTTGTTTIYQNGAVATGDSGGINTYSPGVQLNSALTASNSPVNIGTNGFNGQIDDVRIYNRVLSAAEIQALYNNNSGCAN